MISLYFIRTLKGSRPAGHGEARPGRIVGMARHRSAHAGPVSIQPGFHTAQVPLTLEVHSTMSSVHWFTKTRGLDVEFDPPK